MQIVYIIGTLVILLVFILSWMYINGAVYFNYIADFKGPLDTGPFCALKLFKYKIPPLVSKTLLSLDSTRTVRVHIPNWKAGKTIPTSKMPDLVLNWYITFAKIMSNIVGEKLQITPLDLPTSCCLLIYDTPGDHINWHFDVNYFDGRFFTVLLPITFDTGSTKYLYRDNLENTQSIDLAKEGNLIFEGNKVFHAATKMRAGDPKRIVLSLQYTTNSHVSLKNKLLMAFKNLAYVPIFQ